MTDLDPLQAGRPVRLVPTAPGFWRVTLGVGIAALAPLFGFLVGVMAQSPTEATMLSPIYLGLVVGVVLGGLGIVLAIFGGIRLWRHYNTASPDEIETAEAVA